MSDVKLYANHSRYNNEEFSQKTFESFLNNDPISSFIYSFNNIPQNIEYITSNFEQFIKFINAYPGKAEDLAQFIYDECSDFLSKKESKNENYYNKINVSEKYIKDYKDYFNLPYNQDIPVLILLLPHIKKEVSMCLSKIFSKNYNYLFEDFQNNLTKELIETPNYDSTLSLYLNKTIDSLEKEDYDKALFFANLNFNTYSGNFGYTNIKEETFNNLPFIKNLKENYLKEKENELYLSSTVSSLFQYLSMIKLDFFPLYIRQSGQSPSSALQELINFKLLSMSPSKDSEYFSYFKTTYEKIKEDAFSFANENDEEFQTNMKTQRANLVFNAFLISQNLPHKVNSMFGNEPLSQILKSTEFIEKTNFTYDNNLGYNIIVEDSQFLFYCLLDHKKNVSFPLSFLNSTYELHIDQINENNKTCQKHNDYSNYLSIPELNLNFIANKFKLTLENIIKIASDKPLNFYLSKTYKDNLDVVTSSIKDKSACELNYELLINQHNEFLDLVQCNGKFSQISDVQISQIDTIIKKYFFRPLNDIEMNFSEVSKIQTLSFTSFDDFSIGSFHYLTGNNLSFKERYPLKILDQYIELLSYKTNKENNDYATSLLEEYKPYITNLFESICHSDIYTNCIYNPENMEQIVPILKTLTKLILKSDIWTNSEQYKIFKNIDNSKISLVYYNDPTTYEKNFKYASEAYIKNFKDKLNIFDEIFTDIEKILMSSENITNKASKTHKKIKKF